MSDPQVIEIHRDCKYVIVLGEKSLEQAKDIAYQLDNWWSEADAPFFIVFGDVRLEKVKERP